MSADGTEASKYNFSGFLGAGTGLSFPGPIRLRFHNIEVGTYGIALGVVRSFRQEHIYTQLGAGLSALGIAGPGLLAAIGTESIFIWHVGVRGEFFTFFGFNGLAYSGATIGLSLSF